MIIGYTSGVFDLFHIGHLNMLRYSKKMCDKLIVGVTTDELMIEYKEIEPFIPFRERCEIVENIKCVDLVVPQENIDKYEGWKRLQFNRLFVGDDWHDTPKWNKFEKQLKEKNVTIFYFPYTKSTSSSKLREALSALRH
jgi:glycerol-3-phosphate cytidylyltransferase